MDRCPPTALEQARATNKKLIAQNAGLSRNNQVLKAKVDSCYRNAAAMLRLQIKQAELEGEHVPVRLKVMPERLEGMAEAE